MVFKIAQMLEERRARRSMARMGGGTEGVRVFRPGVGDITRLLALQAARGSLSELPADPRTPTVAQ